MCRLHLRALSVAILTWHDHHGWVGCAERCVAKGVQPVACTGRFFIFIFILTGHAQAAAASWRRAQARVGQRRTLAALGPRHRLEPAASGGRGLRSVLVGAQAWAPPSQGQGEHAAPRSRALARQERWVACMGDGGRPLVGGSHPCWAALPEAVIIDQGDHGCGDLRSGSVGGKAGGGRCAAGGLGW